MKHNLSRPCENCPFRNDLVSGYLTQARVRSIAMSLYEGRSFACHKTLNRREEEEDPEDDGEGDEIYDAMLDPNASSCAGSEIFLHKQGMSTQMGRIAERLGMAKRLDESAPVCGSLEEMLDVHARGKPKKKKGHNCEIVNDGCEYPAGYGIPGMGAVENPRPEEGATVQCRCCSSWVCMNCSVPDPLAAKYGPGRLCDDCNDEEEPEDEPEEKPEPVVAKEPEADRKPTAFQLRVLKFLRDEGEAYASTIGAEFWPNTTGGPAGGGPSRQECAANWQIGKMIKATRWVEWFDKHGHGCYRLSPAGARVLRLTEEQEKCRTSRSGKASSKTSVRSTSTGDSPSRGKRSRTASTRRG